MNFFDMFLSLDEAGKSENNWAEVKEEKHMSGIYSHTCPHCKKPFLGYKRRVSCKKCVN